MTEKPGKAAQEQMSAKEAELKERAAKLEIKEKEYANNLKNLNMFKAHAGKDYEAGDVASGAAFTLAEVKGHGADPTIEVEINFDGVELERFMHELVTINVYPDGMSGSLEVITPTVNGVNQPIVRGLDQVVKRKYVEALARSRITNYQQSVVDQSRPENIQMKPVSSMTYPFVVRNDRNPRGMVWLEGIKRQPA